MVGSLRDPGGRGSVEPTSPITPGIRMKDSASSAPATTIETARTGPPRGALLVIFLTVFIDLLGFGIVLPVMPRQAGPYLETLHLSPLAAGATIGLLFSVFSLMQFVFSPIWGRWSDRVGRRPMLLLSLAGSVVFYALYGFAVTISPERAALAIGLMMLARIGAGIAGASVGTAAAVIADCTTPQNRSRGMALIGIAFGAGFTLGPLIAYFGMKLFNDRPWAVGALASALSAVAFLFAFFVFRETRDPANRAGKEFFSVSRSARVLAIPAVGALVLIYFLSIFSFANFEATLARLTEEAFGMSDDDNFLVFAGIGLVLMLAGGSYRPLAKRVSETRQCRWPRSVVVLGARPVLCRRGAVGVGIRVRQSVGLLAHLPPFRPVGAGGGAGGQSVVRVAGADPRAVLRLGAVHAPSVAGAPLCRRGGDAPRRPGAGPPNDGRRSAPAGRSVRARV